MAGKKVSEGSKKVAGQARKADAAAAKAAAEDAKRAAAEEAEWKKGAKDSSKKDADAAKKAELARKKAEREALIAEDEQNTPGRATPKNSKTAEKKPSRGLDAALGSFGLSDNKLPELASHNDIDGAYRVLDDVEPASQLKVDRHAERRFTGYEMYKQKRLAEMREEGAKLKLSQRMERIDREWKNHPENPRSANYAGPRIAYNATKEEVQQYVKAEREKMEAKLTVR
ncbi:putative duf1014 domain protein [Rosellinia necatrix]|uniref:Putative duf1014 domain protein n=1 Tax=Rosellinia necatrix TaxID=77044 RepID=A0A1W2TPW2_ROSNE|nr:putative duf1014 domain protein [Rosellinia necatrix]